MIAINNSIYHFQMTNYFAVSSIEMVPPCKRAGQVSLQVTLRPLLNITYYGGILTNWNRQKDDYGTPFLSRFISAISISIFFSLILCKATFEFVQGFIEIVIKQSPVQQVVMNIVWFATFPTALWTQICFLRKRSQISALIADWGQMEKELSSLCGTRRLHSALYIIYFNLALGSVIAIGVQIYQFPEATYLISYYEVIRESLTMIGAGAFHLITISVCWILITLNDVLPTFLYSHFGCAICSLDKDLRHCTENIDNSCSSASIRCIWSRFERLCDLLERTNQLFGSMIIISHAYCVFMISTLSYLLLRNLYSPYSDPGGKISAIANVVGICFRLFGCTILAAKVDRAAIILRATLTNLLSRNWDRIPKEDRDILVVFLNRLQCDKVAACPMGLYYLTFSFLLNVSGLIVSYVIILLQSKQDS